MFDLGMQELIVIFVVALIVFGPKRLPELGKTIGKGIGELKRAMEGVKGQMDAEINEIKKDIPDVTAEVEQIIKPDIFEPADNNKKEKQDKV
jgi:Tat protein translocase TatB subunit